MRITHVGDQITIRDGPWPFWILGLFLLAGGVIAVAMPFGLATNADELDLWEKTASAGIGVGVSAGALWWLARNPATQVQLDLTRRRMRLVRFGLSGRQVRHLSFDELASAGVDEGADDEGGAIWRPAIRLRSGETVLLSELWSHDQPAVVRAVAIVTEGCGLI